jgi:ribosomal protein S18 acetylase RimI-like enzyme
VSAEEFASALAAAAGNGQSSERLHSEAAFVASDGAAILGFVHAGIERPRKPGETEQGIIRFLWYEQGHRMAGQALLATAEDYFRQRKMGRVQAFPEEHRYLFYHLKHAYLSDRVGHVHALMAFNGFERVRGEVYLDWPDYEAIEPTLCAVPADISLEWMPGRGRRPTLKVRARQGDKEIGTCVSESAGEWSHAEDAQDWFLTTGLGVSAEFQGKGLGRHLLGRALQEMRGIGYRHAAISTDWLNPRAFLFYSNYGYHVVDWTYAAGRQLE